MDPVTHVALGASLAHVFLSRRIGRAAAAAGALAGLAPDADIFIGSATDPLLAIEYHRGFTHALVFVPAGAAMVAAVWLPGREWRERGRWLALWAAAGVSYLSHVLLDAATSYGTRLFWPFSDERAGWDWIAIVDPAFTVPLLVGIGFAWFRRNLRPVVIGLVFAAAYLAFGIGQHERALAAQHVLALSRGHRPERAEVMPTLANNLVWRTLYVHEGRIHSDRIRVPWFGAPTVREGWSVPLAGPETLTPAERARDRRRSYARFACFSENWVARSPADPTVLADMRYSLSADAFDPIWGIRFTTEGAPAEVEWINRSRDRRIDPGELWREITGADTRYGQ